MEGVVSDKTDRRDSLCVGQGRVRNFLVVSVGPFVHALEILEHGFFFFVGLESVAVAVVFDGLFFDFVEREEIERIAECVMYALSKQKDMLPVLAHITDRYEPDGYLLRLVADEVGVDAADILDFDLSLYDTTPACLVGANDDYITSGRLDDLSMVHAAMVALLSQSDAGQMTRVMAIFDNEETGSGTKQGAASPELDYILRRICLCTGGNEQDYMRAVARSFMVSADNAHGIHPNYPEKQDPTNHPVLGGGPVIKINANCKYMTDADSAAVFRSICERAEVPFQYFVNHSDVAGGSTLGNILTSQIPLRGVDMGAALWAMHSVRETASAVDHEYVTAAFSEFYRC